MGSISTKMPSICIVSVKLTLLVGKNQRLFYMQILVQKSLGLRCRN